MQILHDPQFTELTEAISFFAEKNWIPATSSNFSLKLPEESSVWITRSGVDKTKFSVKELMQVDLEGCPVPPETDRPSAETLIHCAIYNLYPESQCVLHTHGVFSTLMSMEYVTKGEISLSGYELLKAFPGINTHEVEIKIPVYPNSQDMEDFSSGLIKDLGKRTNIGAFLMAGHGLYTYGVSVKEARRITEASEHLLEILYRQKK